VADAKTDDVADLHAGTCCGNHQNGPPNCMSLRNPRADRSDEHDSDRWYQDHDFEALRQHGTNEQTDHCKQKHILAP
jgi:hypothetical protein